MDKLSRPVNPNNENSRAQRAIQQHEFYTTEKNGLKATFGKSVVERYFQIRDALFPPDTYKWMHRVGVRPAMLVSRSIDMGGEDYPHLNELSEELLPNFFKLVDEYHDELQRIGEDSREQLVMRFAAALYVIGITLHASIDGNGQTYQCLVLSYIHEFLPQYRNNFFPLKYSQEKLIDPGGKGVIKTRFREEFGKIEVPPPKGKTPEDQKVIEYMHRVVEICYDNLPSAERMQNLTSFLEANVEVSQDVGVTASDTVHEPDPMKQAEIIGEKVRAYLEFRKYSDSEVGPLIRGYSIQSENVTYAMQTILRDKEILLNFIRTGDIGDIEGNEYSEKVWAMFGSAILDVEKEIATVLQNNSDIQMEEQFQEAKNYEALLAKTA
jgi:hypothetical protein